MQTIERRARRAAERAGLVARKSRWRLGCSENAGGFMLVDPATNLPVAGYWYDLSPEAVIAYCAEEPA